ncbi:hypothetical protein ACA097_20290 [Pseudomonas sp. QL9]|uniref:hypothetical protein n=1 Tax=Pseudomonas TaxID=286 RepID=UPI00352B1C41
MNSLDRFVERVQSIWGPLSSEVVAGCQQQLDALLKTPVTEPWLADLHQQASAQQEMYRDPVNGFVLLAHTEPEGLYRPPHDHGRGWVIYAVQHGEIEMGTYARVQDPDGKVKLVKRGSSRVRAGQTQVYLPGDIHDTHCISGPALLFRFTERDLKKEDKEARKLTRYVKQDGDWVPASQCAPEWLKS